MPLLTITVDDPANVIQNHGTGAKIYIQRGTTDLVADSTALDSIVIDPGQTQYEYPDLLGIPGTHRYFVRYGAAVIGDSTPSGWRGPILAGDQGGQVVTLEAYKRWAEIDDTVDDPWLPLAIGAMNRAVIGAIGVDLGPSPDTVRLYDGDDALDEACELWIPGGIRTFTTVEVSEDGGVTWIDVTTDIRIRPAAHSRPYGEPGSYIEFIDLPTTVYGFFPDGDENVRITVPAFEGFGWSAWPDDIVQDVQSGLKRMMQDRQMRTEYPNETNALRYLNRSLLLAYRRRYFPGAR